MLRQKKLINDKNWDVLVILDACRYDYFECAVNNQIRGELESCISEGSVTPEWISRTFEERWKDTIYVSGNPFINSKKWVWKNHPFSPQETFHRVIDAWKDGWNKETKMIEPSEVTKRTIAVGDLTDKRIISHYMQPHPPYFGAPCYGGGIDLNNIGEVDCQGDSDLIEYIPKIFRAKLRNFFGRKIEQQLTKVFGLRSPGLAERFAEEESVENLREAYKGNLNFVLKNVQKLVDSVDGRIVISADHGHLLGENGLFDHLPDSDHLLLRRVPWLEVRR